MGYLTTTMVCKTSAGYDAASNMTSLRMPTSNGTDSRYITWEYTDDDLAESVKAPSPQDGARIVVATHTYDAAGRLLTTTDASGDITRNTWSADGLLLEEEVKADPRGPGTTDDVRHVTKYGYDADGNRTTVTDAAGETWTTSYTTDALVAAVVTPLGHKTSYDYDAAANPIKVFSPNTSCMTGTDGAPVNCQQLDEANTANVATENVFTNDNLLKSTTTPVTPDGTTRRRITYSYDGAGRKTEQTTALVDARGQALLGRSGGTQRFSYYRTDKLKSEVGRDLSTIDYVYDAAGNETSIGGLVGGGVTATYYLDDLVRTVDDGDTTVGYSYDGAGQLVYRTDKAAATPTQEMRYRYNDAGAAESQTSSRAEGEWSWTYDDEGRRLEEKQPNDHVGRWNHNPDDTLDSYTLTGANGDISKWRYTHDELYRVIEAAVPQATAAAGGDADKGTYGYDYDADGRLIEHTIDNEGDGFDAGTDTTKIATWDPSNNRLSYGKAGDAKAKRFTYNADDTIRQASDDAGVMRGVAYDDTGRMASDVCSIYGYDGFDRLTSIAPQPAPPAASGCNTYAATATYQYDGLDRRRSETLTASLTGDKLTTKINYDGLTSSVLKETETGFNPDPPRAYTLDPAGAPKSVTKGANKDATDAVELLNTDGKGNVVATTSAAGEIKCTTRFDPFGQPTMPDGSQVKRPMSGEQVCGTGSTQNTHFFRSGRRDQTAGTYQMGSRTYDPNKAAFLTPDSYRNAAPDQDLSVGTDPLTRNRYSYVNGDPVNLVDPDGHAPCTNEDSPHPSCRNKAARPNKEGSGSHARGEHHHDQDEALNDNSGFSDAERESRENFAENYVEIRFNINSYGAATRAGDVHTWEDSARFYKGMGVLLGVGALAFLTAGASVPAGAGLAGGSTVGAGAASVGQRVLSRAGGIAPQATARAQSAADYARLTQQLRFDEAASVFTKSGGLQQSVIQGARPIVSGSRIGNPDVVKTLTADGSKIADWAKFTTQSFQSPSGPFQVHFYRNTVTGATNYALDYKVMFGGPR